MTGHFTFVTISRNCIAVSHLWDSVVENVFALGLVRNKKSPGPVSDELLEVGVKRKLN